MKKLLLTFLTLLPIAGCVKPTPTMFGVPQTQWNQLSAAQQTEVIRGYNQRQQTATANEPLLKAISTASAIANTAISQKNNKVASTRSNTSTNSSMVPSFNIPDMSADMKRFAPGECKTTGNTTTCHSEKHISSSTSSGMPF